MPSNASLIQQWQAAVSAGAYSHLSGYAAGDYDRRQAEDYLMQLYGALGTFTRSAAIMVVDSFDAGRIGQELTIGEGDLSQPMTPGLGALATGELGSYQYDVSIELTCYDTTDMVFTRIVSDATLSGDELYGQALDAAFERITSPQYGGAAAAENCEPTGNFTIHSIYALQ